MLVCLSPSWSILVGGLSICWTVLRLLMDWNSPWTDYKGLQQTMADYSRLLTMVSTMASSDSCQWVRRTMTVLLLSFTAVKTMEVVLHEVSGLMLARPQNCDFPRLILNYFDSRQLPREGRRSFFVVSWV